MTRFELKRFHFLLSVLNSPSAEFYSIITKGTQDDWASYFSYCNQDSKTFALAIAFNILSPAVACGLICIAIDWMRFIFDTMHILHVGFIVTVSADISVFFVIFISLDNLIRETQKVQTIRKHMIFFKCLFFRFLCIFAIVVFGSWFMLLTVSCLYVLLYFAFLILSFWFPNLIRSTFVFSTTVGEISCESWIQ